MDSKKPVRLKKSTREKNTPRFPAKVAGVVILIVGVVAATMLIAAGGSSPKASTSKTSSAGAASATKLTADTTPNAAAESGANAASPKAAPVTITGCLERHDETFRLKDTTGVEAAKSRSWKSGFLKKGSASIEVVDAANKLKLTDHVGQRVSVTGVLVDREMQGRTLKRVAPSCNN
jgi:hypothetical protein